MEDYENALLSLDAERILNTIPTTQARVGETQLSPETGDKKNQTSCPLKVLHFLSEILEKTNNTPLCTLKALAFCSDSLVMLSFLFLFFDAL